MAPSLLAMMLATQSASIAVKPGDEVIVIREPQSSRADERTARFFCADSTIEVRAFTGDLGKKKKGSYLSQILFGGLPIPYDDLVAINAAVNGRTIRDVVLSYCNSHGDDHDAEMTIVMSNRVYAQTDREFITLRFLRGRLVTAWEASQSGQP